MLVCKGAVKDLLILVIVRKELGSVQDLPGKFSLTSDLERSFGIIQTGIRFIFFFIYHSDPQVCVGECQVILEYAGAQDTVFYSAGINKTQPVRRHRER